MLRDASLSCSKCKLSQSGEERDTLLRSIPNLANAINRPDLLNTPSASQGGSCRPPYTPSAAFSQRGFKYRDGDKEDFIQNVALQNILDMVSG